MNDFIYTKGWKYRLEEDYVVQLTFTPKVAIDAKWISVTMDGLLTLKSGYAWDGASGPTLDSEESIMPSAVHDACYQLIRMNVVDTKNRKVVDKMFYNLCIEEGMNVIRASLWYVAVRLFGGRYV